MYPRHRGTTFNGVTPANGATQGLFGHQPTSAERFCPTDTIAVAPRATMRVLCAPRGPPDRRPILGAMMLAATMPPAQQNYIVSCCAWQSVLHESQPKSMCCSQRHAEMLSHKPAPIGHQSDPATLHALLQALRHDAMMDL